MLQFTFKVLFDYLPLRTLYILLTTFCLAPKNEEKWREIETFQFLGFSTYMFLVVAGFVIRVYVRCVFSVNKSGF